MGKCAFAPWWSSHVIVPVRGIDGYIYNFQEVVYFLTLQHFTGLSEVTRKSQFLSSHKKSIDLDVGYAVMLIL